MYEEDHFMRASADGATQTADSPPPSVPGWPPADVAPEQFGAPSPGVAVRRDTPTGPTIYVWQLLLIIAAVGALVAGTVALLSGSAQAVSPLKVPIELRGWPGGPHGVMPIVRVRIGDGPPVPVMLDTGSTGLNILARDLPAQSHVAAIGSIVETWGGGNVSSARTAVADVSIAGLSTTRKLTIGIIQSVKCRPGLRHCMQWVGRGAVGILGIRHEPRFPLTNPLASLPRPYSRSWSIGLSSASGTLELGAPIPAHPTASFALPGGAEGDRSLPPGLLPARGQVGATASSPSDISLPAPPGTAMDLAGLPTLCWQLGHHSARMCVPTMFDTGSTDTMLFSRTGALPIRGLPIGTALTAWSSAAATTPLWSLTSGWANSENLVLTDGHRLAVMDTGIAPFYAFHVTYDDVHGRMYLTPGAGIDGPSLWRRSADALCTSYSAKALAVFKSGPQARPDATLVQRERAAAYRLRTLAKLSLRGDGRFARLDVPRALSRIMAKALRADRAAARMTFAFVRTIPRYRSLGALERALTRFQRAEKRADADWERMLARFRIAGCS